jgi:hypothetical protein
LMTKSSIKRRQETAEANVCFGWKADTMGASALRKANAPQGCHGVLHIIK